jgi:hypothetical protein
VRQNKKATIGFFVAENSDRVYLARLDPKALAQGKVGRKTSRLIGIDKAQISDIEVGAPKPNLEAALEQARTLASELCGLEPRARPGRPGRPPKRTRAEACWNGPPVAIFIPPG